MIRDIPPCPRCTTLHYEVLHLRQRVAQLQRTLDLFSSRLMETAVAAEEEIARLNSPQAKEIEK